MEWRDCRSEKKDGEYKGEWTVRKSSFHQWWKTSNLKTICVSFCKAVQMNKMCFFFNFSKDISIAVLGKPSRKKSAVFFNIVQTGEGGVNPMFKIML